MPGRPGAATRGICAMFKKILIANRGAIACRILRTLKAHGHCAPSRCIPRPTRTRRTCALADEASASAPRRPPRATCGSERILEAARQTGAQAIHPGYGFLTENADFAEACEARGHRLHRADARADARLRPQAHGARAGAAHAACRCCRARDCCADLPAALAAAETHRLPGDAQEHRRRRRHRHAPLRHRAASSSESFAAVQRLAAGNFSNAGVFLEKFVARARHIEVQIFGDGRGAVIALGERDCSVQRRNQKVIEETPAPGLDDATRARLHAAAVRLGEAVQLPLRGHGRVRLRRGRGAVLLPRSEHAPAGGARRHRGSRRHRPRRVDGPHRGRRAARSARAPARAARPRDPGARLCRRSGAQLPAVERPADAGRTARGGVRVDGWVEPGTEVSALLRSACSPRSSRAAPRASTRSPISPRALRAVAHRRHRDQPRLPGRDPANIRCSPPASRPRAAGEHTLAPASSIEVLAPGTLTTVQD